MKVSPDLVGCMVAIQLVRPVYMFEYAGHAKFEGADRLVCAPIMRPGQSPEDPHTPPRPPPSQPAMSDVLLSAYVEGVDDDAIDVTLFDPDPRDPTTGNTVRVTVPTALILQVVTCSGFEVPMPTVVQQRRAPAPESKIVL